MVTTGAHKVSASRAAQASEARLYIVYSIYIYTHQSSLNTKDIYICNELIEETVRPRKSIFGMWEFFGYGSSKFGAQTKMLTHHGIMTSLLPFLELEISFFDQNSAILSDRSLRF